MRTQTIFICMITLLLVSTAFSTVPLHAGDAQTSSNTDARAFHDYTSMTSELQEIAATYSDITRLYELGFSVQGRTIWGLKITDNPDIEENEAEIRFDGCHHGNEYMSVELPLLLAWHLVENYSVDPTVTDYVDNREIWIVPMVNPDGRQMNQRRNANNVDINRDYGYMWNGEGSSPSPFSQPETQAIRNHGLQNNIVISYSYHTTAEYVNYLWDYKPQPSPDEPWIDMISQCYADLSGYEKTNGFDWYQTTGASDDGNYGCFSNINTIIETLNSDIPQEWDRNRDAMMFAIDVADMGLTGVVTDALTGEPLEASVWVIENYWPCYTDPNVGDYHKALLEGTYHVNFRANGYEEQTKTITITDANASNVLNAALMPSDEYYGYQVTVCKYFIYSSNPTEGISSLGPPDYNPASLGTNGMMVVDMGNASPIVNGLGDDFTIYEADDDDEGYYAYVSEYWDGPWSSYGTCYGTCSFDLEDVGLEMARFVKIVDDGITIDDKGYAGFDLDAIQAYAPFVPEHDIIVAGLTIPDVVAHGEIQTVSATVGNIGNSTETDIVVDFIEDAVTLDTTTISSLVPGEYIGVNFSWNPAIGTYLLEIASEPVPDEYDLLNNNVNKTVQVIVAPAIEVTPPSLSFLVPTEASDSDSLTIANLASAEASLTYSIVCNDGSKQWLSASPLTGTVAIDDADVITVTVDTSGLDQGEYEGSIVISSNDLDDPEVVVPVSLTVVYGNDMKAVSLNSPTGVIPAGSYTVNATVQNIGSYPQTGVVVNCSIFEGGIGGVILDEDFSTNPSGWTITHVDGTAWTWDSSDKRMENTYGYPNAGYLDSPVLDCSGKTGISLSFWHDWDADYSGATQDGYVRGSIDGGATFPFLIDEFHDSNPAEEIAIKEYDISSWADGQSDVVIRFDVYNYNDWHWYIDDVNLSAEISGGMVYYAETLVDVPAYQTCFVEFSPAWDAILGLYGVQISTKLGDDENPANDMIIEVVSVEGPDLAYDPGSYNFGSILVNTTNATSFDIWNDGVGILTYTLDESASWVSLSSYGGTSSGEHDAITVIVNATGLSTGAYHCDVDITSDGGSGVFGIDMFVVDSMTPMLDVEQTIYDRGFPIRHAIDGDWGAAQSFTPTMSAISGAEVYLRKFGTPEFDLTIELREENPEGTLLDTIVFTPAEVGEAFSWIWLDFEDTPVTPDTTYFLVIPPAPSGVTTSFGYEWGYAFGDQYGDGAFWFTRNSGALWRDLPTMYEYAFKTYGLL